MTRINLVAPWELSDQHLIAEYRELPRVIKGVFNTGKAPNIYKLGAGHVLWAKCHEPYLLQRYKAIIDEMNYRGVKTNYTYDELLCFYCARNGAQASEIINGYSPTKEEIMMSQRRISEKYQANENLYRWTKREKPKWLLNIKG